MVKKLIQFFAIVLLFEMPLAAMKDEDDFPQRKATATLPLLKNMEDNAEEKHACRRKVCYVCGAGLCGLVVCGGLGTGLGFLIASLKTAGNTVVFPSCFGVGGAIGGGVAGSVGGYMYAGKHY